MRMRWTLLCALLGTVLAGVPAAGACQEEDPKAELQKKMDALDENDAAGWFDLALWCDANGLRTDYKRLLRKVIKIETDHEEARQLLGYEKYDDKWVTSREKERLEKKKEEEEMLAKGFRKWEGEWHPAEDVEMFEKGLFKVEVDGEAKWVTAREKERIEQGLVLYRGQWIKQEDKDKIDQGLFKVGEEWLTKEEADVVHQSLENPWEIDGELVTMITTCGYDFAQTALNQAKKAVERSYQIVKMPMPEDFSKFRLMMVNKDDDYRMIGEQVGDDQDAAMSSSYPCFSFQEPDAARYAGVVTYSALEGGSDDKNDQYTCFMVRHAAAEAAVRNMPWQEEVPRWFVTGVATYCGRYWDPFSANGVQLLGQWSANYLHREGGLMKLKNFFDPYTITAQTVLQSGLLISFLEHGQLPDGVKEQWDKVRELIASEKQKGLAKEFLRFEQILAKEEKAFQDYADSLLQG